MLDNGFDFKVRDELRNVAFDKRLWMENIRFFKNCGHGCQTSRDMLLDMIIFASFGGEELAETNAISTTVRLYCEDVSRLCEEAFCPSLIMWNISWKQLEFQ